MNQATSFFSQIGCKECAPKWINVLHFGNVHWGNTSDLMDITAWGKGSTGNSLQCHKPPILKAWYDGLWHWVYHGIPSPFLWEKQKPTRQWGLCCVSLHVLLLAADSFIPADSCGSVLRQTLHSTTWWGTVTRTWQMGASWIMWLCNVTMWIFSPDSNFASSLMEIRSAGWGNAMASLDWRVSWTMQMSSPSCGLTATSVAFGLLTAAIAAGLVTTWGICSIYILRQSQRPCTIRVGMGHTPCGRIGNLCNHGCSMP